MSGIDLSEVLFENLVTELASRCDCLVIVTQRPGVVVGGPDHYGTYRKGSFANALGLVHYLEAVYARELDDTMNGPNVSFPDADGTEQTD